MPEQIPDPPPRGQRMEPPGLTWASVSAVSPDFVFLIDSAGGLWAMSRDPSDGSLIWRFLDGPPPPQRETTPEWADRWHTEVRGAYAMERS